jgi:hypothetical protein
MRVERKMKFRFGTRRMRHANFDNAVKISRKEAVREIPKISKPASTMYKHCLHEKKERTEFISKEYSIINPLEILHNDLCGPMRTKGLNGEQYCMLLIDDYTKMTAIFFLKKKFEAFQNFRILKETVENQMNSRIKCLISNNGGEFISK